MKSKTYIQTKSGAEFGQVIVQSLIKEEDMIQTILMDTEFEVEGSNNHRFLKEIAEVNNVDRADALIVLTRMYGLEWLYNVSLRKTDIPNPMFILKEGFDFNLRAEQDDIVESVLERNGRVYGLINRSELEDVVKTNTLFDLKFFLVGQKLTIRHFLSKTKGKE